MSSTERLPRDFYLVTAANFVFFLNFASFFLLPVHLHDVGASAETIGYVMGTAGFAGIVLLPFLGVLLDRVDRRRFVIAGGVVMAAASYAYLLVPGASPVLYVLRVVQGMAFTAAFVTASTLAAELAPLAIRGRALGLFGISTLLTHAIAPAVGEVIARRLGFAALFAFAGTLGLGSAGLSAMVRAARTHDPARRVPAGAGALRREPVLWLTAATMTACGMGFGTVLTFVPTFVHVVGLERVAPFFLSYSLAAIAVRVVLGGLSDRVGRRPVLLPAMAVLAAAIAVLGLVGSVPALVAVGVAFGAGQGMVYPTANALMVDLSHAGNLGRVQTLFSGSFSVGVAISAFVFGGVIERFGYPRAFAAAAGCVVCGMGLLWLAPPLSSAMRIASVSRESR
ncbi:MAG: MFS transporter [Deltaproteobacteria bacterium]|nr:MFS transporter [Deltaproteobacteria bacterium]